MREFPLKIVTPDGLIFDGKAEEVVVRTISGDLGVLAGHVNCAAALGMGRATLIIDGKKRYAACIGGILSVIDGEVNLVPTTFEWAEQIDASRAANAEARARAVIADKNTSVMELKIAEARLKRALVRQSVAESNAR